MGLQEGSQNFAPYFIGQSGKRGRIPQIDRRFLCMLSQSLPSVPIHCSLARLTYGFRKEGRLEAASA
jgi:hypothetical protein